MKQAVIFIIGTLLSAAALSGQTLKVLSPDGGESWPAGQVRVIRWQAQGIAGTVKIILRRAGEKVGDIAADIPASQGSFSWTVGALIGGGAVAPASGYVVRVRTTDNLYTDDSNAGFRIFRQVTPQEQQRPDLQAGQGQPRPDLRPGQSQGIDPARLSGMPDLTFGHVYYYFVNNTLTFDVLNRGLAAYTGNIDVHMEVEGGGCHDQTMSFYVASLAPMNTVENKTFQCDFFPDPCSHRFRLTLVPHGADERRENNVFDEIVFKYVANGAFRLGVQAPIRLRFTRASKSLTCSYYAYNTDNTITRDDVRSDSNPGEHAVAAFLEVPVRNCCGQSQNSNLELTIEHRSGGTERDTLYHGKLANADFVIPAGQERLISRAITLPIQPGDFFVTVSNPIGGGNECQVAFKFADEFFD